MPPKRKGKAKSLGKRLEVKRKKYDDADLRKAIADFFAACDEDGNGFLEPHEFVVAQAVVAELAGEAFDDDAARAMFQDVSSFDKSGDSKISCKEFSNAMAELCEAIPRNADELVSALADKAAEVIAEVRREVGAEIRRFFRILDQDEDGTLDAAEINFMIKLAKDLAKEAAKELGSYEAVDEYLSIESFEKGKDKDGRVEMREFINHFLDFTKVCKIPKRDIVTKLRHMQAVAKGEVIEEREENVIEKIKAEMAQAKDVLNKYG